MSGIKLDSRRKSENRNRRKPAESTIERGNKAERNEERSDQEFERTDAEANGHGSEG